MMNYDKAFKAGMLGALAITVLMVIARAFDVTTLNIEMALGSMLTQQISASSWMLGFIMHIILGGLLAQLYAFGFEFLTERTSAWIGAGFSLIHSSIAGMVMFVLGSIHPLMRNHGELLAPGPFAINYGTLTAVAFVGLHLVYGSWVGSSYSMRPEVEVRASEQMPRAA
jgi:hypothetical protein